MQSLKQYSCWKLFDIELSFGFGTLLQSACNWLLAVNYEIDAECIEMV